MLQVLVTDHPAREISRLTRAMQWLTQTQTSHWKLFEPNTDKECVSAAAVEDGGFNSFFFSFFSRLNFDNLCRPDLTKSSAPRTNLNITTALSAESVYFVNNRLSQSQHNILLADENVINHVWKLFCRSRRIAQQNRPICEYRRATICSSECGFIPMMTGVSNV